VVSCAFRKDNVQTGLDDPRSHFEAGNHGHFLFATKSQHYIPVMPSRYAFGDSAGRQTSPEPHFSLLTLFVRVGKPIPVELEALKFPEKLS
jgi:hypothetical protein